MAKEKRPGKNFEVLHIIPPWSVGDVLPPTAFKEYPARYIELGAIRHTHDEPTVEVVEPVVGVASKQAGNDLNQDDYDELAAENGRLVFELNAATNKLGAAEARAKAAEDELKEAKPAFKDLTAEYEKRGATISELNAELNRLRLEKPKTDGDAETEETKKPDAPAAPTVPPSPPVHVPTPRIKPRHGS